LLRQQLRIVERKKTGVRTADFALAEGAGGRRSRAVETESASFAPGAGGEHPVVQARHGDRVACAPRMGIGLVEIELYSLRRGELLSVLPDSRKARGDQAGREKGRRGFHPTQVFLRASSIR